MRWYSRSQKLKLLYLIGYKQELCQIGPRYQPTDEIADYDLADESFDEDFLKFKEKYYLSKLKRNFDEASIQEFCYEYLKGLDWVLRYYLTGNPSWQWLYPFHYVPFTSDLIRYIPDKINFEIGKPCHPLVQLMCIMPKESFSLLPAQIKSYLSSQDHELIDMFPISFQTDLNGKVQEYEAVVLIPFPRVEQAVKVFEKLKTKIDPDEIQKFEFDKNYLFENKDSRSIDIFEAKNSHIKR